MKVRKRAGRNLWKITQSLADAAATSLKGGEFAVASGRVIAERAALGVGALVIGMASELAAIVTPSLKTVVAFAILVLVLLVRPNGLLRGGYVQRMTASVR